MNRGSHLLLIGLLGLAAPIAAATWTQSGSVSFSDAVVGLEFSSDSGSIAVANWDTNIYIVDPAGESITATLSGHSDFTTDVTWSPNGTLVASGSLDRQVMVWDSSDWTLETSAGHSGSTNEVSFSPDGSLLAVSTFSRLTLYNTTDWTRTNTSCQCSKGLSWSPDGTMIATGFGNLFGDTFSTAIWDVNSLQISDHLPAPQWIESVDYNPDGTELVALGTDGAVSAWDTGDHSNLTDLDLDGDSFYEIEYAPDGNEFAISRKLPDSHDAVIIDASSFQTLESVEGPFFSVTYSPDGAIMAGGDSTDLLLFEGGTSSIPDDDPEEDDRETSSLPAVTIGVGVGSFILLIILGLFLLGRKKDKVDEIQLEPATTWQG